MSKKVLKFLFIFAIILVILYESTVESEYWSRPIKHNPVFYSTKEFKDVMIKQKGNNNCKTSKVTSLNDYNFDSKIPLVTCDNDYFTKIEYLIFENDEQRFNYVEYLLNNKYPTYYRTNFYNEYGKEIQSIYVLGNTTNNSYLYSIFDILAHFSWQDKNDNKAREIIENIGYTFKKIY